MTGEKKSIEFFFGATTYIGVVISIIIRPDMASHDKLLTVAMLHGVAWLAYLFFRFNKDKILGLNESLGADIVPKPAPRQFTKDQIVSSPESTNLL